MFAGPMQRACRPSRMGRSESVLAATGACAGVVSAEKYASKQAVTRAAGRRDMAISRTVAFSHRISAASREVEQEVTGFGRVGRVFEAHHYAAGVSGISKTRPTPHRPTTWSC